MQAAAQAEVQPGRRGLRERVGIGAEPLWAPDRLKTHGLTGDGRGVVTFEPMVEPAQLQGLQVLPVQVRDVVPRAGHQLEAIGHRLIRRHGSAGGTAGERVLQRCVVQRRAPLERVMPPGHQKHRDAVLDDLRYHVGRTHGVPERAVERGVAAGDRVFDQVLEVVALIAAALAHCGNTTGPGPFVTAAVCELKRRVDHVQQRIGGAVRADRPHVRYAAHGDDVAIEVVGRHGRKNRLQRRVGAYGRGRQQLVDGQVGDTEHADAAIRIGQGRCPIHQVYTVLNLLGSKHLEGPARHAGAPHVGHHLDVATANQVRRRTAADLGRRRRRLLAVRRHRQQHRERSGCGLAGGRVGRVVDVDPQGDAVAHRYRHVVVDSDAVPGGRCLPRRQQW